jgi:branched-chain amino acid transport system substrate-binding protein
VNKKLFLVPLVLLLVISFIAVGCSAPAPVTPTTPGTPAEKVLKVGSPLALTGWFSVMDLYTADNIQFMGDIINEQGGITVNGEKYKVQVVIEDIKSDFDGVTAATNRLIHDDGVNFVIGPTAFFIPAASPVTEPAKVLKINGWLCNTPGEMDTNTPYSFSTSHGALGSAIAAMKYVHEQYPNVKKVALVIPDDGAIPYLKAAVTPRLQALGITVVGDVIGYPNEMEDFSPIVAKLNSMKGDVDAVFQVNGIAPHMGAILKGMRSAGNKMPYILTSPVCGDEVVKIAGAEAVEGLSTVIPTWNDPKNGAVMQEVVKRFTAKNGNDAPLHFVGPTALYLLKTVIEQAGSVDPSVVKAKWESMDKVDTIFGQGTVCGMETFGIKHYVAHPMPVQRFENGKSNAAGWYNVDGIP